MGSPDGFRDLRNATVVQFSLLLAATLFAIASHHLDDVESRAAEARQVQKTEERIAAVLFVRAGVTDRKPNRKWVSRVASLQSPVADGQVASDLVYFARGYDALRRGDFPGAKGAFAEASRLYDFFSENTRYMLAYYAYAAANSGDTSGVETLLGMMTQPEHQRFDYHLAKGVLASLSYKHDEAVRALERALQWRPFTDERPLHSAHQYAEIVEWIYESTRRPQYREALLAWARANRDFSSVAWPHAIIAKHSPDAAERRSAAAATLYLDPNSERLSSVDKKEFEAVTSDFSQVNPFLVPQPSTEELI